MRDFIKVTTDSSNNAQCWLRRVKGIHAIRLSTACGCYCPPAFARRMRVRRAKYVHLGCYKCRAALAAFLVANDANHEGGMFDA